MGQMRFVIPQPQRLVAAAVEQAYLAGPEGIPWECANNLAGNLLTIERDTRESGYVYFPWNVPGRGIVMLSSGSLMERLRAYHLPVELARGTLNRLRNQWSAWQGAGMVAPPELDSLVRQAGRAFARAATGQAQPVAACGPADEAIRIALDAIDVLTAEYSRQVLSLRRPQPAPGLILAGRMQAEPVGDLGRQYLAAFNTALVAPQWHEVEPNLGKFQWDALDAQATWCRENDLRLCLGPLLQFDRHLLPDWLFLDDDFDEVQLSVLQYLDAVVKRYRGKVQLWHVAARMNLPGALKFTEEQRLRLVVEGVDRIRAQDARTPMIVSFDQPWGEYIAREDQELTPLHFADTLIRGELGLAGIGIEMNLGYFPGGTQPRDPAEVSRQLDRWSQLGVPLIVFLTVPSAGGADSLAQHKGRVIPELVAGGVTAQSQQATIDWLLPLLMAKPSVQAIVWNQWRDDLPHDFPHGGLIDAKGNAKPGQQTWVARRGQVASQ
jgi:hypothetical protein